MKESINTSTVFTIGNFAGGPTRAKDSRAQLLDLVADMKSSAFPTNVHRGVFTTTLKGFAYETVAGRANYDGSYFRWLFATYCPAQSGRKPK